MTGTPPPPPDDDPLAAIEEAYARDRPAPMPGDPSAPLTPAMLLHPEAGQPSYDNPATLSLIARWDPSEALAIAAFVRLVGRVARSRRAAAMLLEVYRETRHDVVQQAVVGLLRTHISNETVAALGRLAGDVINRWRIPPGLEGFLDALTHPDAPRQSPVPDLLAQAHRHGVDTDGLRALLRELVASPRIPLPIRLAALDDLDQLPTEVAQTIRDFVLSLPPSDQTDPLRQAVRARCDDDEDVTPPLAEVEPDPPLFDLGSIVRDRTRTESDAAQLPLFDAPEEAPDAAPARMSGRRRFAWPEEEEYPSRRGDGEEEEEIVPLVDRMPDAADTRPLQDRQDPTAPDLSEREQQIHDILQRLHRPGDQA